MREEFENFDNTTENKTSNEERGVSSVEPSGSRRVLILLVVLGGAVVLMFLTLFYYYQYQTNSRSATPQTPTEQLPTLSDEEVAAERRKLPLLTPSSVKDIVSSAEATNIENGSKPGESGTEAEEQSNSEDSDNVNQRTIQAAYTPASEVVRPSTGATEGVSDEPRVLIESDDDSVQMGEIRVRNTTHEGDMVPVERLGVVQSINYESGIMVIADTVTGSYLIRLDGDTQFVMNNQRLTISGVRPRDVVEVRGFGYPESIQLDADEVTVVGEYSLPESGISQ